MNKQDLIPLIVQEECAEVIQAISKCFRFGKDHAYTTNTNKHNLEIEIGQLVFAIDQLKRHWDLSDMRIIKAYNHKQDTHKQWEEYFHDHQEP